MKKKGINLKSILSFIEGNLKFYYSKLVGLPPHLEEQIVWRLEQCKEDCIPNEGCVYCGCDPVKKIFVKESCNDGERFPDLMDEVDWKIFRIKNNIE